MKKNTIRISPDFDSLLCFSDGCCSDAFGDIISNDDSELGPCFEFVIPGIDEWHKKFEIATDFANTTTDADFDWKLWHYDGLCFAKAIRKQLPQYYTLIYEPPYEDKSNTISDIIIDDNIDSLISSLYTEKFKVTSKPSFIDYMGIKVRILGTTIELSYIIGNNILRTNVLLNQLPNIKHWLESIILKNNSVFRLCLSGRSFAFFKQTLGNHSDMGRLHISKFDSDDIPFCAYVNIKEFVKSFYLSLMTELGFGSLHKFSNNKCPSDILKSWIPYNSFKSRIIEQFINDKALNENLIKTPVIDTYVMYPDWGGCIFWDSLGVGSGNYNNIYTDFGNIKLDIPGLKKWSEFYDNHDDSQTFEEYRTEGWKLAKIVRQQLPDFIDLYYMCYDPQQPDKIIGYRCDMPSILVPK